MITLEQVMDQYPDEQFIIADGFDDAILGVDDRGMRLVYSVDKCIEILCQDMEYETALEHFDYNIAGAYVGERTPIWIVTGKQ